MERYKQKSGKWYSSPSSSSNNSNARIRKGTKKIAYHRLHVRTACVALGQKILPKAKRILKNEICKENYNTGGLNDAFLLA